MRLDKYLVEAGFVISRTLAAKLIAAGDVQVNGKVARKASMLVGPEDTLYVSQSELTEYVSRAGHKLAGALDAFPDIKVEGKRCLDAGASTGGFTDVLLRRGAAHVAAVDVGHGQLVDTLREEPRVGVYEGLNVRYMKPEDIGGHEESARREAVEKVQASAVSHGMRVMGMEPSPLPGQDGNVEYFLWCKK